jgi:hypothetical protein
MVAVPKIRVYWRPFAVALDLPRNFIASRFSVECEKRPGIATAISYPVGDWKMAHLFLWLDLPEFG